MMKKRWKTREHWETLDNMETDDVGAFLNWKHENDEMLIINDNYIYYI